MPLNVAGVAVVDAVAHPRGAARQLVRAVGRVEAVVEDQARAGAPQRASLA